MKYRDICMKVLTQTVIDLIYTGLFYFKMNFFGGKYAHCTRSESEVHFLTISAFYGTQCSSPYSQQPSTCPYPESDQSSLRPTHFLKIHFNIILPSTPRSSKWFVPLGFSTKFSIHLYSLRYVPHAPPVPFILI